MCHFELTNRLFIRDQGIDTSLYYLYFTNCRPLSIEDIRKNVSLSLKLRLTSYNPLLNNCEHFATGCRYGTKSSQQV